MEVPEAQLAAAMASPMSIEEMESAIPMELAASDLEPEVVDEFVDIFSAAPSERPGSLPNAKAMEMAQSMYPAEWQNEVDFADTVANARYQPYLAAGNWYFGNSWMPTSIAYNYPRSTVGRLYFKIPGDNRWHWCTASVFQRRALWTAGHCVATPGKGWHRGLQFWPATRNNSSPYGVWYAKSMATTGQWLYYGRSAYDIGGRCCQ